jgi:hypothetical protein
LAIACACLVYAEWDLMPEIGFFAVVTAILVLIAYLVDGKWALSIGAANVVGGLIAGIAGVWAAYLTVRPTTGQMRSIPWPTSMLPFLGPFLMILLPAKLFRPKHVGDYWGLHFIGLVSVALACTLADDAFFTVLLGAYLFCGMWSLALFLLHRHRTAADVAARPSRLPRIAQVASWAVPVFGVAAVGFLCTPRSGNTWELSGDQSRVETGITEEAAIDLNSAGNLELNRDVAFEVYATDNEGRPKLDLDPVTRWRGPTYRYYQSGRWTSTPPQVTTASGGPVPVAAGRGEPPVSPPANNLILPDLGPEQFFLRYQLRDQTRFAYLAMPFVFPAQPGVAPAIRFGRNDQPMPFVRTVDGGLEPQEKFNQPGRGRYQQVARPATDPTVGAAIPLDRVFDTSLTALPPIPAVANWTTGLVRRLAEAGAIPTEAVEERTDEGQFHPRHHEVIARGLERFLAGSGQYKYSLELRRTYADMDPVEDFLLHTKVGPCTRFASALGVMLRSIRIPCMLVQGYRGCDPRGDGHYDVRQCHAHAWVEVLVQRVGPAPAHGMFMGPTTWHWVVLDPTPTDESLEAAAEANIWWNSSQWAGGRLFRDLILNFSPERRDQAVQAVWEAATAIGAAAERRLTARGPEGVRARLELGSSIAVVLVGVGLLVRRRVRRRAATHRAAGAMAAATAFYRRLLAALARRGWKPADSDTPLEFAVAVAPKLPDTDAVALVNRITALYYRVRFGAEALGADEQTQIDDGLARLAARLAVD